MDDVSSGTLAVTVAFPSVDEWWGAYTLGVGPAGDYVARLSGAEREVVRSRCAELLPRSVPFELTGVAWAVRATV
jgi:hypothetical protein